jgi:hypothetical protein
MVQLLAAAVHADPDALGRLARSLSSMGVSAQTADRGRHAAQPRTASNARSGRRELRPAPRRARGCGAGKERDEAELRAVFE